jgi:hypothetical protein
VIGRAKTRLDLVNGYGFDYKAKRATLLGLLPPINHAVQAAQELYGNNTSNTSDLNAQRVSSTLESNSFMIYIVK